MSAVPVTDTKAAATAAGLVADEFDPVDEEDDEFEEFQVESWDNKLEDAEDLKLWGDNWDDDDIDDSFLIHLRAELARAAAAASAVTNNQ